MAIAREEAVSGSRVFEQAMNACVDYLPGARLTDVIATLTNNTWKVSNALSLVYRLIICACAFAVFLVLLVVISPRLAAVALVMLVAGAAVVHLATRRAQAAGREVVEETGLAHAHGLGDLADRPGAVAAFGEDGERGFEDRLAGLAGLGVGAPGAPSAARLRRRIRRRIGRVGHPSHLPWIRRRA